MLRLAAACALICLSSWPAAAEPPQAIATIHARLTPEGLAADVRLSRAVTRFAFDEADVVREGDIEVRTEGLTLSQNAVTAARPFQRFSLLIRPARIERDAKYPAFYRLGDGGVLYAPTLRGAASQWRTDLRFTLARGHATTAANLGGSIYIGPRTAMRPVDGALLIAAPNAPPALLQASAEELSRAMAHFTDALGVRLPRPPVIAIAHTEGGTSYVGDVTPGPFVSLRFYGGEWAAPSPSARIGISRFIAHEAFHFWNGSLVSNAPGTPSWLHEGGADYAALLSTFQAGALDDAGMNAALGAALNQCRQALNETALDALSFLPNQVRYPCGLIIQWAGDLSVRAAGGTNVLDVWAAMIATASAREDRSFNVKDFTGAPGMEAAAAAIALLVEQSGAARWDALAQALRALGAEVGSAPILERQTMLFHLLRQNCTNASSIGFYTDGGRIRFQEEAACGAFSDVIPIEIEGGDPFETSPQTYARVQQACAAKQGVAVLLDDGTRLTMACRAPLPDAPLGYAVTSWR